MGDFFVSKRGKYILVLLVAVGVYFGMKYVSPVVSPFLFAFLLAGLLNPLIHKIQKKTKINKPAAAAIFLFFICILAGALLWWLGSLLVGKISDIAVHMPQYEEQFHFFLGSCCDNLQKNFGMNGVEIENFVLEQANIFVENFEVNVLPQIMGKSVDYVKNIVQFVSFVVVMAIALLLIIKDYDKMVTGLKGREEFKGIRTVGRRVLLYIKTYLKAQIIILCIISAACSATLWLSGMRGGVIYGIITGFMDMLPFIGTGIMLIPLAVIRFINGFYWQAVVCLILYGFCALIREFLEPKLIGKQMGIWPVGILFAVFAGLQLFGLFGIIKGPLSLVIICETYKYLMNDKEASEYGQSMDEDANEGMQY